MKLLKSILFPTKNEKISFNAAIIGSLFLVGLAIKMYWGISNHMDILLWDEAFYLKHGFNLKNKIPVNWGPFYSFWYYLLHFIDKDKVDLYYLNFKLMAILPVIAAFWFFLFRGINYYVAFIVCFFWLSSDVNLTVWPKVSQFTNFVLFVGLIIGLSFRIQFLKYVFFSFVALCISYARPELFLSFLVLTSITVLVFFIEKPKLDNSQWFLVGFLVFLGAFLIYFLGVSLIRDPRSGVALSQHFMLNYNNWNHVNAPFWLSDESEINKIFNHPKSVGDFYANNPEMFKKHIISNVFNYLKQINIGISDVFFPKNIFHLPNWLRWLGILVSVVVYLIVSKSTVWNKSIKEGYKKNVALLFILLFFCFPAFISSVLIYPREHYFALQFPFLLLLLLLLFYSDSINKSRIGYKISITIFLGLLFFFISPKAGNFKYFDLWRSEQSLCNQKTIKYLKVQKYVQQVNILENEGGLNSFLPKNYKWVKGYAKTTSWSNYLKQNNINIIYLTPSLLNDQRFEKDMEWKTFVQHPEKMGFMKIKIGDFEPYLLIKKQ